jgi:hypothetical protein
MLVANWRINLEFFISLNTRMFTLLKNAPFKDHTLTQEVYRVQGLVYGNSRFAKREVLNWNYANLSKEGIDIVKIHEDFQGCDAVLTTSRNEWVQIHLRISNDYPFRSPTVTFLGSLRPKVFSKLDFMVVDSHFEYAFTGVEDTLRSVLLETDISGVMSKLDPSSAVVFL